MRETDAPRAAASPAESAVPPPAERAAETADGPVLEAVRRPLVAYSGGGHDPWAAKIAATAPPAAAARAHHAFGAAAATLAVVFVAAFLLARPAIVRTLPDLAGLYAALGLPVNLDRLELVAVTSERRISPKAAEVRIAGTISNPGAEEAPVPGLVATFRDSGLRPLATLSLDSPVARLPAHGSADFLFNLADAPRQAHDLVLRFAP
ncbi:hypothetical protein [Propylenella binzhouense]|uniref:DUF3426 domain-containing protein n=1 Tax=Propylenella binzhouense TaxID=2555902 RepID=A0A964T676_9HYPH|nr:hypothetical protein [Propylenella binzhouense]MYZ49170.1 hypothetical protein [Propylenella binzhouense]